MPLYIAQSGDLEGCNACLTDGQTLNDSATQLLTKYKSGALVTQYEVWENWRMGCVNILPLTWRFSLGDIVNTTFMGLSQTRKYPCVLLCENESHTLAGLGQSVC